jgi:LysR family glycine cleavage system transcriptional activator
MNRRNLQFNALRAFEAAARHASVSGAARELSVTHSAISHQLRRLEQDLGVRLFQRTNRGLKITPEGETLAPVLIESFDRIAATIENLRKTKAVDALHVTSTPSFASKWLVPRLGDWYASPEACRINLRPALECLDFNADNIDIAIRCGVPPWGKLAHELLMPIHLVPVCSPDYFRGHPPLQQAADILEHDLIHADVGDHGLGDEWRNWLSGVGIEAPRDLPGLSFHDPALAMQAAADGLGLAIGYLELIDRDLRSGKLVTVSNRWIRHQFCYYLVYPESSHDDASLTEFRDWIRNQLDPPDKPGQAATA